MKITIAEAIDMDLIVALLISRPGNYYDAPLIKATDHFSDFDEHYISALVDKIVGYGQNVVQESKTQYNPKLVIARSSALHFIKTGGFEKLVWDSQKETRQQIELKSKETLKLQLEIDDLSNRLIDYSTTKWQAKWSFRISILAVILTVIAIMQEAMCKKP